MCSAFLDRRLGEIVSSNPTWRIPDPLGGQSVTLVHYFSVRETSKDDTKPPREAEFELIKAVCVLVNRWNGCLDTVHCVEPTKAPSNKTRTMSPKNLFVGSPTGLWL
jgi:hypothetical protein